MAFNSDTNSITKESHKRMAPKGGRKRGVRKRGVRILIVILIIVAQNGGSENGGGGRHFVGPSFFWAILHFVG